MGDIACFDVNTGEKKWAVNLILDMHGENAVFGYSVPVMIEGERIFCLPGGPDTNIACLNRYSGEIIWTAKSNGETPGYASPVFIRMKSRNIIVAYSELTLIGLDADTGEQLWTYELSVTGLAPCNTPVYSDGFLYIAGPGNGAAKLELSADGSGVKTIWGNDEFDPYFGGFVKINNTLYGASKSRHSWLGIDAGTGRITGTLSFGTGSTIAAGDDLVIYDQGGSVGLVQLHEGNMTLVKSFKINKGTNEHFSHPVVDGNRLFIRHGNVLLIYDYREFAGRGR